MTEQVPKSTPETEEALLEEVAQLVLRGEAEAAVAAADRCLGRGIDAMVIILSGANQGMQIAGRLYEEREYYVPELVFTAEAMQIVIDHLKPHVTSVQTTTPGTVILGVVAGDIHSIGKNIVRTLLESRGLEVVDLGEDVEPDRFVAAAVEHEADFIGMSTLMTTTLESMEATVDLVAERGVHVRTIIGGSPVNDAFRRKIGADAYALNGNEAVRVIEALLLENMERAGV